MPFHRIDLQDIVEIAQAVGGMQFVQAGVSAGNGDSDFSGDVSVVCPIADATVATIRRVKVERLAATEKPTSSDSTSS